MDKGSVAIVTGGGQGIGRAIVKMLLENGLRVVIAEMDEEAGRETLEEYHGLGECIFIHTDISDETAVKAMFRETIASFRGVYALINNAGIFINKPLAKMSLTEWNRVLGINPFTDFVEIVLVFNRHNVISLINFFARGD